MKLIGIMSLREDRDRVRDLLRDRGVRIYSEADIVGHSQETIASFGWFATPAEIPQYGSLCFAILPAGEAEALFQQIGGLAGESERDHPIRAFLVPVEAMI
jgi:hypothetical protein